MAKCEICNLEMLTSKGCTISNIIIGNKKHKRIKVGDKFDFSEDIEDPNFRCHDCGATTGHYHHLGCDAERCPKCHNQLITCDCEDVYIDESEKIRLKNEKECVETYLTSDMSGLMKIEEDLKGQGYTEEQDIMKMVISTYNITYIFLECQTEEYADSFYSSTYELYTEMWNKLWEMLGVDLSKHWEAGEYVED